MRRQNFVSSVKSPFKYNAYRGIGNACPLCASTSGKCSWQAYALPAKKDGGSALDTTKTLCMTGAGGYGHPDFHYFGDTRDGQWGIYVPLVAWSEYVGTNTQVTPAERQRWVEQQQLKQQALLAAENHRRAESLPPPERDLAARSILAQRALEAVDRQDLIRRGFTDRQIRTIGFKSVDKWQRLKEPVHNRFPGVTISGHKLYNSIAGILIPLYTVTGEIVAFQVRNREKSDRGRYRWLSSSWEKGRDNGAAPQLPNGENPLTFVYPQLCGIEMQRHSVGIAEGTGAKPHLAAIRRGQQVIGAAGGQWLSSPELLHDGLERWRADIIDLYLDGEDLHKPEVLGRWVKLYHQLQEWGYRPRLLYSGHDIDELDDLARLRELDVTHLAALVQQARTERQQSQPAVVSFARKLYQQSHRFTADITQTERFVKWDESLQLFNALIAIKSALGTGKTEILKAIAAWARSHGLELLIIGYRNNLLRQTCDRIPDLYHVVDEDRILLDSDYHKALCHHSAGLIDPAQMGNKIIILDECVSSLSDMLTSKLTAGRRKDGTDSRQCRLAQIEQLIKNCYGIIALDAYLSDTEVNFLSQLRHFERIHKLENTYRNQMSVRLVERKSTVTRAILDDALAGANLLVTATTQKHCENLELALIRVGIEPAKICRIDGKTDRDENIGLFFRNPQAYLERFQPQIVILSPTGESGISIDAPGYFQTHYHFHLGNLGVLSGLQFLGRYRDFTTPRVIFCEERGQLDAGNSSSFTKGVKDEFDRQVHENMNLVLTLLEQGATDEALKILTSYANQEDLWLRLAHQYQANLNEEMKHLRELFVAAIRADGYTVTLDPEASDGCDDTDDLMGRVEVERRTLHAHRIYHAPDIDRAQYEAIKNDAGASETDRLLASKYHLTQQQLPGIMATDSYSPELIQMLKYNYPSLIKQLEHYHYLLNPELAQAHHLATWLPLVDAASVWLPDRLQRSPLALVNVGRELGLHDVLGKTFTTQQIIELVAPILTERRYQSILKLRIAPDRAPDPIKLCRRVVKQFALKLVKVSNDHFQFNAMANELLAFKGAPRYELLTPELSQQILGLAGCEFHKDDKEMQSLAAAMAEVGMHDGSGRMRLIAGAARHLGLAVTSRRHRTTDAQGKKAVIRIYSFGNATQPLSTAINNSQIYPGTHPVQLQHVYQCITKRLTELAAHQQERVNEWQAPLIENSQQLDPAIHLENVASNDENKLPQEQCGSVEFSRENIESVIQTLIAIGQMDDRELKIALDEYLSVSNLAVVRVALELLRERCPQICARLRDNSRF